MTRNEQRSHRATTLSRILATALAFADSGKVTLARQLATDLHAQLLASIDLAENGDILPR